MCWWLQGTWRLNAVEAVLRCSEDGDDGVVDVAAGGT